MQPSSDEVRPIARRSGLVIRNLDDEVLIYDLKAERAHCLVPAAGAIFRRCDGETSVTEIAAALEQESGRHVPIDAVWQVLTELDRDHLLEPGGKPDQQKRRMSRRQMMLATGATAALSVPFITSIRVYAAPGCGSSTNRVHDCACTINSQCTAPDICCPSDTNSPNRCRKVTGTPCNGGGDCCSGTCTSHVCT